MVESFREYGHFIFIEECVQIKVVWIGRSIFLVMRSPGFYEQDGKRVRFVFWKYSFPICAVSRMDFERGTLEKWRMLRRLSYQFG